MDDKFSSFKVGVAKRYVQNMFNNSAWPLNVRVDYYRNFRRRRQQHDRTTVSYNDHSDQNKPYSRGRHRDSYRGDRDHSSSRRDRSTGSYNRDNRQDQYSYGDRYQNRGNQRGTDLPY